MKCDCLNKFMLMDAFNTLDDYAYEQDWDNYERTKRLIKIYLSMIFEGFEDGIDWNHMAEFGWLCDKDWEWFAESLEEAGVDKEEYYRKWKVHG